MPGMPTDPLQFWLLVLPALALYAVIVVGSIRASRRLLGPELPARPIRWSLLEIILAYALGHMFWQTAVYLVLSSTGVIHAVYGDEVAGLLGETSKDAEIARIRVAVLCAAVAFPFELLSVLVVLRFFSNTQPTELGLTFRRAGVNTALGVLAFLVITPLVFAVNLGAQHLMEQLGMEGVKHPFEKLTKAGLPLGQMIVLTCIAVICAPIMEELIFRGVIQPWLALNQWGGHLAMGLALVIAGPWDMETLTQLTEGLAWQDRVRAASPLIFVLALTPFYVLCWRYQKTPAATAIFGTSLLFAMVHKFAWPHPVPLFFLSLGLGWLAYRTQSLVGSIVLHSLFNGVGCVQLWLMR